MRQKSRRFLRSPRNVSRVAILLAVIHGSVGCAVDDRFEPEGTLTEVPETFDWPSTKAASAYVLRVFAPDGTVVFESRRVEESEWKVGRGLREKLAPLVSFEWEVRIYDGDRIAGTSDRRRVTISP